MRTEKIIAIVFIIGLFLKVVHFHGGPVTVLALSMLALLYLFAAFRLFRDRETGQQDLDLSIVTGILLSSVPIAILFKLQYWAVWLQGGTDTVQVMLLAAAVLALAVLAGAYFLRSKAGGQFRAYYRDMMARAAILTVLAVGLYITPTSTLLKVQFWDDPELARLWQDADPGNAEFQQRLDTYHMKKDPPKSDNKTE